MSSSIFLRSLRAVSRQSALRSCSKTPLVTRRLTRVPIPALFSSTSSSRAALAQELPAQPTVLLDTPSPDYIKEEELDVELIPPEQVKLVITDRAAEVSFEACIWASIDMPIIQQLRSIATRENNPATALRIAVESGGCHGYQYKMELARTRSPDD